MIEPPLWTALVSLVGLPALTQPGLGSAGEAAIALAAITMAAQPEHRVTRVTEANSLPENYFVVVVHLPGRAGLDTARRFVGAWNLFCCGFCPGNGACHSREPHRFQTTGFPLPPSASRYLDYLDDERAFGADDVARLRRSSKKDVS